MGFLQGDTNNIILDAVLTDKGREFLARNDGSFSITKWSPGDDEVDYTIIQKFGRTVGKEKIEKNTPIFEALTNGNLSQKYRLISVSNPNLVRLPNLTLNGAGLDSATSVLSMGLNSQDTRRLTVEQTIEDETSIDVELRDQAFIIEMSNLFLEVEGNSSDSVDGQQRATYLITRDAAETSTGGSRLTIDLGVKSITESQFEVYGRPNNKNIIDTFVKISGIQSGAVIEFQVSVNQLL